MDSSLTGTHVLSQRIEVHAHGAAFPATVGWHPWFLRVGQVAELAFQAAGMLRRDASGIPDGVVVAVPPGPGMTASRASSGR